MMGRDAAIFPHPVSRLKLVSTSVRLDVRILGNVAVKVT